MKKTLIGLIAGILGVSGYVGVQTLGASNNVTYTPDVYPTQDSTFYVGTTSKAYKGGVFDELCLGGSCQSSWSAGSYPDYLSQVGDVSTSSLAQYDVLYWTGTEWNTTATSSWNGTGTYLPLSGGVLTGSTTINSTLTVTGTSNFATTTISGDFQHCNENQTHCCYWTYGATSTETCF